MTRWIAAAVIVLAGAAADGVAEAAVLSFGGDVLPLASPTSVEVGATESDLFVRLIAERQDLTLPSALRVNLTAPGLYDDRSDLPQPPPTLATGLVVDSYLLHADPWSAGIRFIGRVTFHAAILGIIVGGELLEASDAIVGLPIVYPGDAFTSGRGLALSGLDVVNVSADGRSVDFAFTTRRLIDQFRVITAAQPTTVPESPVVLLLGGGALLLWARTACCRLGLARTTSTTALALLAGLRTDGDVRRARTRADERACIAWRCKRCAVVAPRSSIAAPPR